MTVAGEAQAQSKLREVVRVRQLDQRIGEPQLDKVFVDRYPFNAPKYIGQIRGRRPHGLRDITEMQCAIGVRFEEQLHTLNQPPPRAAGYHTSQPRLKRAPEELQ